MPNLGQVSAKENVVCSGTNDGSRDANERSCDAIDGSGHATMGSVASNPRR